MWAAKNPGPVVFPKTKSFLIVAQVSVESRCVLWRLKSLFSVDYLLPTNMKKSKSVGDTGKFYEFKDDV